MGDNFCLLYDGNINNEITDKILDLSEYHFEIKMGFPKIKKKMTFLLAECFQNIIRHSGKINLNKSDKIDSGFFLTRNIDGVYYITSGNLIKNANVKGLKDQLENVNSLDKEGLRELYVDVLANKGFSKKGGAGLGLIEIARKSGQKIEYVFDEFNDEFSIFYNQVMLNPEVQISGDRSPRGLHFSEAIDYHRKMLSDGIIIVQKGDFSSNSILPVLEILEENLPNLLSHTHARKDAYHVIVEILQNISKFGVVADGKKEGIFLIRKGDSNFTISAGNYIEKFHIKKLEKQIQLLNKLNNNELKINYLKALGEDKLQDKGGARIELIEIARRAKGTIQFSFKEPKPDRYFFTISVTV